MVSKAFFTGSKYLVEDNDGRQDYLRYDDEKFLTALAVAGRKVIDVPIDADDEKAAYLKSLVRLNEEYFEAREFENEAKGWYYKHDERSERHFRYKVAERFSDRVEDLRTMLAAHQAVLSTGVEQARESSDDQQKASTIRSALLACTDRAVSGGWYPTVKSYYYSLSPGELVAEDRERQKQRIEGTESSLGIDEILSKPLLKKLSKRDLRRIREVNRESPGPDTQVWKRIHENYWWYLSYERGQTRDSPTEAKS